MNRNAVALLALLSAAVPTGGARAGDPISGERYFRACGACHSLVPDRNMTGPSLAGVIGRKAGTLPSFQRYSPALKSSSVVWDEHTLDVWLTNPVEFIPGSRMTFQGIEKATIRSDLIAYLKIATASGQRHSSPAPDGAGDPNLKNLDPENKVRSITFCPDTYRVTTADGQTQQFWEHNLRFKTDSSPIGPDKGVPALFGAGMQGDRASIIFSSPEEISSFIARQC